MADLSYATLLLLPTLLVPPQSLPEKWRLPYSEACLGAYTGWTFMQFACVVAQLITSLI